MAAADSRASTSQSAAKALDVLQALMGNFYTGCSPGELAKATGLEPSSITRYVATLEEKGLAERIPETGRIRVSTSFARRAVQILQSIDAAERRVQETRNRLMTPTL